MLEHHLAACELAAVLRAFTGFCIVDGAETDPGAEVMAADEVCSGHHLEHL